MKDIILKLNKVKDGIISEGVLGTLFFFGLIARVDLENKWDVLISAKNIQNNNSQDDLVYVIDALKKQFTGGLSFISRIVLLTQKEDFIKDLGRALEDIEVNTIEVSDLKLTDNFTLAKIYVIHRDFSEVDLVTKKLETTFNMNMAESSFT